MPPIGPERGYLKEIYELTKDNNRMLHRMRRSSLFWGFIKFIWWAFVILILPAGLYYYYLAPQIARLQNAYQGAQDTAVNVQNLPEDLKKQFQEFMAKFGFGSSSASQ